MKILVGFAVMNIISLVIGTYWLETTLARSLRLRRRNGDGRAAFISFIGRRPGYFATNRVFVESSRAS